MESKPQQFNAALRDAFQKLSAEKLPLWLRSITQKRIPVANVVTDRNAFYYASELDSWFFPRILDATKNCRDFSMPLFRAIPLDQLEVTLTTGGVISTEDIISASDLKKALEYGEQEKLVLILNSHYMKKPSYEKLDRPWEYAAEHGWVVPGNPFDALAGLITFRIGLPGR